MPVKVTGTVHIVLTTLLMIVLGLIGVQWNSLQNTLDLLRLDVRELRQELKVTQGVLSAAATTDGLQGKDIGYLKAAQLELKVKLNSHIERHTP